jgi:hypothetical protein
MIFILLAFGDLDSVGKVTFSYQKPWMKFLVRAGPRVKQPKLGL